jgi:hypothetical protein
MKQLDLLTKSFEDNIIKCRVSGDRGALAVLSDVHQGLNDRKYLQDTVKFLLSLGDRCKVILGGDSTNTTTKNSKGNVLEEWCSGSEQIYTLVDDMRPLYESGQLIGIIEGNHPKRAYNEAYITIEEMIASLLGDKSLYKGSMGVVYFNVNDNLYVHQILHKHRSVEGAYDYFSADVNWYEHKHKPMTRPRVRIEHNKFVKKPVAKQVWDIYQSSFQVFPDYAKSSGYKPSVSGYYICEMTGDRHNRMATPYFDSDYINLIKSGYIF